jgi:hypothetical protein
MSGRTPSKQPQTPLRPANQPFHPTSPPVFTPSKLTLFLEHAEKNLGVASASIYETDLCQNSYGPDILHLVDTQALTDLGILVGDTVCLKNSSQAWWSGPKVKDSKHKAVDQPPESPPDPKKYCFEMCFNDGRGTSYFGSAIKAGKPDTPPCNYTWWFFCPLTQRMQLLPDHHVPKLAPGQLASFDDDDSFF